jgi:dolichyl-phosphate beta-glucosyltransferase
MHLSIVIPAYNEASRIGPTLEAVGTWLSRQTFDAEVLVVDNRSSDGTAVVVREWAKRFPAIRVIEEKRGGKGYAVQAGMLAAQGEIALFMDADNSTSIEHFEKMRPALENGHDVVIGSLAVPGAVVMHGGGEPLWRVVLGKLGNLWIQLFAVPGIWDTQRGFKVFKSRAAKDIFPRLTIFGWGFDVEVLAVARARGYKVAEVPIHWSNDPDSKVNVWAYPKTLLDTVKVGRNRLAGRYR